MKTQHQTLYLVLRGMQRKKREQTSHKKHDRVA
jgi:hypothetical protein